MVKHTLKIRAEYFVEKLKGNKSFEIRWNDRNYQVGDLIQYIVIDDDELNEKSKDLTYRITYITNYEQKPGWIVFGDELYDIQIRSSDASCIVD